ncbi:MAG: formylglycine-generating enzyme family protein [Sandaracinaceae bacterium]
MLPRYVRLVAAVLLAGCGEPAPASAPETSPGPQIARSEDGDEVPTVRVPAGTLHTARGVHAVAAFRLHRTLVTVDAFARFVAETGHVTAAERLGEGAVLELATGRWTLVRGATFRVPRGPEAGPARGDDPATQIGARDAEAYCAHVGGRLPSEVEWEHAARNGRDDRWVYPWGDVLHPEGRARANTWEGAFPTANTLRDGHLFASPVEAFPPSPLGLRDAVGNVWQWTASALDPKAPDGPRAIRGGSHLCDPDVCHGFRIDARQGALPDEPFAHIGFRCAFADGAADRATSAER